MSRDSLEAQCARFEVPEDRSKPDGRKVALNIAWLPPSNEADAAEDPVFFLAGVRGGDPAEIVPWIVSRFDYIGLLEEMALSHTILSQLLCMPDADVEHRRSTEEVAANAERPTEAQLDRIRAKNRLDEALFNAVSLTHRRLRARSLPEVAA